MSHSEKISIKITVLARYSCIIFTHTHAREKFVFDNLLYTEFYTVYSILGDPASYTDICDGAVYRELSEHGNFLDDPSNLSLTMYTDGVRFFSSSKFNIWPIYFTINELPYAQSS